MKKIYRNNMIYYSRKEPFDFKTSKTIRSLGENIYRGKITINKVDLVEYILNFSNKARPKNRDDKKNKKNVFNIANNLYEGRKLVINAFKSGLFPLKSTTGTGRKTLTPKQMLQKLPIALAQVKAGNNLEN